MEFLYPMVKFFTAGGAFMVPILLVGAVAVAITIERYITLSIMAARNRRTWTQVETVVTPYDMRVGRRRFLPRWTWNVVPPRLGWFHVVTATK